MTAAIQHKELDLELSRVEKALGRVAHLVMMDQVFIPMYEKLEADIKELQNKKRILQNAEALCF